MNITQIAIGALGLLIGVLIARRTLTRFRQDIQTGDDIGVKFGKDVVNRRVLAVTKHGILVTSRSELTSVVVPLTDVYMPDTTLFKK